MLEPQTPQNNKIKYLHLWLVLIPLAIAFIYVLPPLYAYLAYDPPEGKRYSQLALGQLYNADEYGFYIKMAEEIVQGRPPYIDLSTYEGRDNRILPSSFLNYYIIAAFLKLTGSIEMTMPVIDVVFAILCFYIVFFITVKITTSNRTAILAATVTLLPPPILRIIEKAPHYELSSLPYLSFFTDELPRMSRTYAPQMVIPIFILFLFFIYRIIKGDTRFRNSAAAGVCLGAMFYLYVFSALAASIILFKCLIGAECSKKRKTTLVLINAGALSVAVATPFLIINMHVSSSPLYNDFKNLLGAMPFNRLDPTAAAAVAFFVLLYIVFFTPSLKKPAAWAAAILAPITLAAAILHSVPGIVFFFTPAIILLFAASLPRQKTASLLFIPLASFLELPLLLRYATGKSLSDVYFFYWNNFLPLVPLFLTIAAWSAIYEEPTALCKPRILKTARAAFPILIALLLLSGVISHIKFTQAKINNYFISANTLDAVEWLDKNAAKDSVVLSFDANTNTLILIKSPCRLYLPKAGMATIPARQIIDRMARASAFLAASPDDFAWDAWNTWGFYLFGFWTEDPQAKESVIKTLAQIGDSPDVGRYKLDYVFFGPTEKKLAKNNPETMPDLKKVYANPQVSIYAYSR